MENLLIVGVSTTARSIYKFVTDYNLYRILGFVVDKQYKAMESYCGLPVVSSQKTCLLTLS